MRKIDIQPGTRFGKLTVIQETAKRDKDGSVCYKCRCDCGGTITVSASRLRKGDNKSCGCLKRIEIESGTRVGKLVVLGYAGARKGKRKYWVRCDCGRVTIAGASKLNAGEKKSCACLRLTRVGIGERFGRLKVIKLSITSSGRDFKYLVLCDCGQSKIVSGNRLVSGHTRSCGCLIKDTCKKLAVLNRIRPLHMSQREFERSQHYRKCRELADPYIRNVLTSNTTLTTKDIPQGLVKLKRAQLQLKRSLKTGVQG